MSELEASRLAPPDLPPACRCRAARRQGAVDRPITVRAQVQGTRDLEDLLIECIYSGLVQGTLDQQAAHMEVFACAGRDVHPSEVAGMAATLQQWHRHATGLIGTVSGELGRFKQHTEEARRAQAELDARVEAAKTEMRARQDAHGVDAFGGMLDADSMVRIASSSAACAPVRCCREMPPSAAARRPPANAHHSRSGRVR